MGLRLIQVDEERWWRKLQLAASALAGGLRMQSADGECAANFGRVLERSGRFGLCKTGRSGTYPTHTL
jgi:hypothetical protein